MTKPNTTPTPCPMCGAPKVITRTSQSPYCTDRCRFMGKVEVTDTCWLWTGAQDGHGYGQINIDGRPVKVHRWALQHLGGIDLDPELHIDHLCRVRHCVNPAHLEQVTNRENCLRGNAPTVVTWRTGVCKRGHSMSDAIVRPNGSLTCRPCENTRQRRYYHAKTKGVAA